MIVRVNYENNAWEWWASFWPALADAGFREQHPGLYEALRELVWRDSVEVGEPLASELARWAASLPGWEDEDAPEYAPHPLLFSDEAA